MFAAMARVATIRTNHSSTATQFPEEGNLKGTHHRPTNEKVMEDSAGAERMEHRRPAIESAKANVLSSTLILAREGRDGKSMTRSGAFSLLESRLS